MNSFLKATRSLFRRSPLQPIRFPTAGFTVLDHAEYPCVQEEGWCRDFKAGMYYPVHIGDVYQSRYQVIGKLGYGRSSTVWLAHDLNQDTHVSLKVFTRNAEHQQEIDNYAKLSRGNQSHIGSNLVRGALGSFTLARPGGDPHYCLVQEPMLDSFHDLVTRYSHRNRFTEELLKAGLRYLFSALDYVHSECQLIHTDIKPANILQTIADTSVFEAYTKAELEGPVPRKYVQLDDGSMTTVYGSRLIRKPSSWGYPVLGDFGSAVDGNKKHTFDAQPSIYRCPEVMLRAEWGYPADIWNVGAMIWDLFQCKSMFDGQDPDGRGYTTRAHLAQVIGLIGPPPPDLLQRGGRSSEFFTAEGDWKAGVPIPVDADLRQSEAFLNGEAKDKFLEFMRCMLQWRPEDRMTAKQLAEHPWLRSPSPEEELETS